MSEVEKLKELIVIFENIFRNYEKAILSKDLDLIGKYWTDDALFLVPDTPKIQGLTSILQTAKPLIETYEDWKFKTSDVYSISENSAIVTGLITSVTSEDESEIRAVVFMEKQSNNEWKAKIVININ